ncbi:hypothetical protein BpHYR1_007337 [Brachionus plicatilis]|uniref:Uncharacterized protein n=1 Tax=Brachionus plicatilis TaxID=10195 RepID=A0A3M7SJH7_BRAPC|nr:hypothetical protein BpHYR1_007337 [Brachionus plicatilis]
METILETILMNSRFLLVNDSSPTYHSKSYDYTSVLDYFIISSNLGPFVNSFNVLDDDLSIKLTHQPQSNSIMKKLIDPNMSVPLLTAQDPARTGLVASKNVKSSNLDERMKEMLNGTITCSLKSSSFFTLEKKVFALLCLEVFLIHGRALARYRKQINKNNKMVSLMLMDYHLVLNTKTTIQYNKILNIHIHFILQPVTI